MNNNLYELPILNAIDVEYAEYCLAYFEFIGTGIPEQWKKAFPNYIYCQTTTENLPSRTKDRFARDLAIIYSKTDHGKYTVREDIIEDQTSLTCCSEDHVEDDTVLGDFELHETSEDVPIDIGLPCEKWNLFGKTVPLLGGMRRGYKRYNKNTKNNRNRFNSRRAISGPGAQNQNILTTPNMKVFLNFVDSNTSRAVVGVNFFSYRYRLNSVFDPDPLIGSAGISGFNEWANLYRRYLVLTVKIETTIVNNENFPVCFTFTPTDIDLTPLISTRDLAVSTGELPFHSGPHILGGLGGQNRMKFVRLLKLNVLSGNMSAYKDSLTYSSLNNTNPSAILFGVYTFYADSNFTASNSIMSATSMQYKVMWTQRQSPLF